MLFDKSSLRKEYLLIRKNIPNKKEKSDIIYNKVINNEIYKNSKVIALYKSLESEVNTDKLIWYSLDLGKIVCLPKIEENNMKFYKVKSYNEKLYKSNFNILEPLGNKKDLINKNDIDLCIVPGVCFDKNKNRIGFGKGYYDKYLTNVKTCKMAICFSEQIIKYDIINAYDSDIKMDTIISDME